MRKLQYVWKFSMFLIGAGFFSLVFLLFLHPMDLGRFVQSAFHLSHPTGSVASPGFIAMSAFWIACAIFALGWAGISYVFLKKHLCKPVTETESSKYGASDECEENWMFI